MAEPHSSRGSLLTAFAGELAIGTDSTTEQSLSRKLESLVLRQPDRGRPFIISPRELADIISSLDECETIGG
jgi:hypothetical protein